MSDETTPTTPAPDPAPAGETTPTPAADTPAPAEAPAPADKPADGEPPAAASADETPEVAKARKILAAASKRAERALEREQRAKAIEGRAKEYDDLREGVKRDPLLLIRLGGYPDIKTYLRAISDAAVDDKPTATPEAQRLEAIERRLKADDDAAAQEARAERIEAAQKKIFAAIDAAPDIDRASGSLGHQMIWGEIEAYHAIHKDVPDEIVWMIARKVEKYLTDEGMNARKKAKEKTDGPPSTMTNGMTKTSAPNASGDDGLPMDGKARMAAILARYGKPSAPVS